MSAHRWRPIKEDDAGSIKRQQLPFYGSSHSKYLKSLFSDRKIGGVAGFIDT
jgi:hypothetical protein